MPDNLRSSSGNEVPADTYARIRTSWDNTRRFDVMAIVRRRAQASQPLAEDVDITSALSGCTTGRLPSGTADATPIPNPAGLKIGDRVQLSPQAKEYFIRNDDAPLICITPNKWRRIFGNTIKLRSMHYSQTDIRTEALGVRTVATCTIIETVDGHNCVYEFPLCFLEAYVFLPYTTNELGDFPKKEETLCHDLPPDVESS